MMTKHIVLALSTLTLTATGYSAPQPAEGPENSFLVSVARATAQNSLTVTVPGTANLWLAGMPDGTRGGYGYDTAPSASPFQFTALPILPGAAYIFSASGSESHGSGYSYFPPDGDVTSFTQVSGGAENGIAEITAPIDSLLGVFLDDEAPSNFAAPAALNFGSQSNLNFLSLQPLLRQPFFIGSGHTTNGVVRQFVAPAGATRLFLGTMDAYQWNNNLGGFTVNVNFSSNSLPQTGSLQVEIAPATTGLASAHWQVDGGAEQASGAIVASLTPGDHTVSFTPVSGWSTPSNETVTVAAGVASATNGFYSPASIPADGLTLLTNGNGLILRGGWPKHLVAAKKYSVTALARPGSFFLNWTGGTAKPYAVLSTSARVSFFMQPNLVLEANFVSNTFPAITGSYHGLFGPQNSARQQDNSGSFTFSLADSGAASGSLMLEGKLAAFSGKFNPDGAGSFIPRTSRGEAAVVLRLQLDFTSETVSGTVSNADFTAMAIGDRAVFGTRKPATGFEGRYTLVLPGSTNPAVSPYGFSYGTVTVTASGNLTLAGSLADGTPITQSSVVSKDGYWPLYVNLYGGKGSLWSWVYFTNQTTPPAPVVSWINQFNPARNAVNGSGFTNQTGTLMGSGYQPAQKLPANLSITLQGGGLTSAITVSNLAEGTADKLTLKTNTATGVITGSFVNPSNSRDIIRLGGVVLQNQTNAAGYFLGTDQSGAFLMEAAE